MFEHGYFSLGRWRGAPIRIHWTMPVGAFVLGGMRFVPVFWASFLLIVLAHELGHAFMVRRYRHRVLSVDITGFGGLCRWSGSATPWERAVIAWGGVMAQGLVLGAAVGLRLALGPPGTQVMAEIESAMIGWNASLIVLNLLPMPPFDGREAWRVFRLWRERRRGRRVLQDFMRPRATPKPPHHHGADASTLDMADRLEQLAHEARRARRGLR